MVVMKNSKKPSLLTFLIGTILSFLGIGMKSYGYRASDYFLYAGVALFGIFWIWSIGMVIGAVDLKPFQKRFWLIAVVAVPVLGGLLFHFMHNRPGRIVT
jgi:hypothetical protein